MCLCTHDRAGATTCCGSTSSLYIRDSMAYGTKLFPIFVLSLLHNPRDHVNTEDEATHHAGVPQVRAHHAGVRAAKTGEQHPAGAAAGVRAGAETSRYLSPGGGLSGCGSGSLGAAKSMSIPVGGGGYGGGLFHLAGSSAGAATSNLLPAGEPVAGCPPVAGGGPAWLTKLSSGGPQGQQNLHTLQGADVLVQSAINR